MDREADDRGDVRHESCLAASGANTTRRRAAEVLVVNADQVLSYLIREWLSACGCRVTLEATGDDTPPSFDLVIVNIPFPRLDAGQDLLRSLTGERAGTPVLVLSSTFFPGIESHGAVARALGVAGVLPTPVRRDALVGAVTALLPGFLESDAP